MPGKIGVLLFYGFGYGRLGVSISATPGGLDRVSPADPLDNPRVRGEETRGNIGSPSRHRLHPAWSGTFQASGTKPIGMRLRVLLRGRVYGEVGKECLDASVCGFCGCVLGFQ